MRIASGLLFATLVVVPPVTASAVLTSQAIADPAAGAAGAPGAANAAGAAAAAGPDSPLRLLASVEEAWVAGDAERLASLVDTTSVRIGLKPGVSPTAAVTRNSAVFLFQDQLRLVKTWDFHVVRLEVPKKEPARAVASWGADWGGRQGKRTLEVKLTLVAVGGRWLLTEVRVDD